LRGRHVVLLPDNDDPGRAHMEAARQSLTGIAASVTVVELPGLDEGGDLSDWIAAGGTKLALLKLVKAARLKMKAEASPPSAPGRETRETNETAPENNGKSAAESVSHVSVVSDERPWTGDLGALLCQVEAFLHRFIIYPSEHARIAHTLWIAHTHVMDAWE